MNRQDKIIVAILTIALIASVYYTWQNSRKAAAAYRAEHFASAETQNISETDAASAGIKPASAAPESIAAPLPAICQAPEVLTVVSNEVAVFTFSSRGASIKSIELLKYSKTLDPKDGSVFLDFSKGEALRPGGAAGGNYFDISVTGSVVTAVGQIAENLKLTRTYVFPKRGDGRHSGYELSVTDRIENTGATNAPAGILPPYGLPLGTMSVDGQNLNMADLSTDAMINPANSKKTGVRSYGAGYLSEIFGGTSGGCAPARISPAAPVTAESSIPGETHWIALRDRFFVQMLVLKSPAGGLGVSAERIVSGAPGALRLSSMSASAIFEGAELPAGASFERAYTYYAGPRKASFIAPLAKDSLKVMSFGTWRVFCVLLLGLLNFIERHAFGGYGMAIIILTVLVRVLLYPINKRNAESMKRMNKIQPLIKEVNEKYADDPQKKQQEIMRIYGEHKVNPLSSCLPMLIQLPIFIALFTILRSSVELRYASFLWISDLSAPEDLFRGIFGFGINILPVAMAGTMALQSYLTPSAGDPAQHRMMTVIMPVMMLVMFYRLPSALCLYWTVSQVLAIFGLLWAGWRGREKNDDGEMEVLPPPKETRQMRRHKINI